MLPRTAQDLSTIGSVKPAKPNAEQAAESDVQARQQIAAADGRVFSKRSVKSRAWQFSGSALSPLNIAHNTCSEEYLIVALLDNPGVITDTILILDAAKSATADIRSGKGRVRESWWQRRPPEFYASEGSSGDNQRAPRR